MRVVKRSGREEVFDREKIVQGVVLAARRVGNDDEQIGEKIADEVEAFLVNEFGSEATVSSQDVGDIVEKKLIEAGHARTAKTYILYREDQRRSRVREEDLGIVDDVGGIPSNGLFLLKKRYLFQNEAGETIETPREMLRRVAREVARAEEEAELWQEKFLEVMVRKEFWPGTRVLANAGREKQQMGNCFVFPMEDSIESIFRSLHDSSVTKKNGGGCGYNFSSVRPKGDSVAGQPGLAAGPIKIMQMFDLTTRIFRQQGRYESGNMAILNVSHPDILDFITAKEKDGSLASTNISLGVTGEFMQAVEKEAPWQLVNPRTGAVVNEIGARVIFDLAANLAHQTGDPGLLFLDTINQNNPLEEEFGPLRATNPCGEQPLYPYESCNLGYLYLPGFLRNETETKRFDYERLAEVVAIAVRMLDDTIDVAWFPVEKIAEVVESNRRIGIGVFGWAETLARLGIPYNSREGFRMAEKTMKTISEAAWEASYRLAEEKAPFPNVGRSVWKDQSRQPRNVALTTLPPSSSHGIIFGTSFGIEPYFALVYKRNALGETQLYEVNEFFRQELKRRGIYSEELIRQVAENHGSLQGLDGIPSEMEEVFVTAHDIDYRDHILMQAAFQKWTDNSVTKTINLPYEATPKDVAEAYQLAWREGCKGVTVYRDNSKANQVIEFGS